MSRLFKGYASAYEADQVQPRRVRRHLVRTLTVDFNGAIEPDLTIEAVTWECTSPWVVSMSGAAISSDQRSVSVKATFNYSGGCAIKATATMSDDSQFNYEFTFDVLDAPQYPTAVYGPSEGPYSLAAVAA